MEHALIGTYGLLEMLHTGGRVLLKTLPDEDGLALGDQYSIEGGNFSAYFPTGVGAPASKMQFHINTDALETEVGGTIFGKWVVGETAPITLNGNTGVITPAQTPAAHKASHEVAGGDLVDHDNLTNFIAAEHLSLPNTIANVLTDHTEAVHNTLGLSSNWKLVSEVDVSVSTNSVSFQSLDLDVARVYFFMLSLTNANAGGSTYYIYFNNDKVLANYWCQNITANGAAVSGARVNNSFVGYAPPSQEIYWIGWIMRDGAGLPRYYGLGNIRDPASIRIQNPCGAWTTNANVTRIDIDATVATGIGAGSKLLLFEAM